MRVGPLNTRSIAAKESAINLKGEMRPPPAFKPRPRHLCRVVPFRHFGIAVLGPQGGKLVGRPTRPSYLTPHTCSLQRARMAVQANK
jgi:hypothetical protein